MSLELWELVLFFLLLLGYGLIAGRLDRWSIGSAFAFVIIGILLSDGFLGVVSVHPDAEWVRTVAEVTLALVLFGDASSIRLRGLERDAVPALSLLTIGLLLTIAAGTATSLLLFPGISLGLALLIAAILAPTDAALGQPVLDDTRVPSRIRRLLNVESGLNDGIATPFVVLALALATAEGTGDSGWLAGAITALAIATVTGVILGWVGGRALGQATTAGWTTPTSRALVVLSLAIASYLTSVLLGGNGFVAAFVGGIAFGVGTRHAREPDMRFTEATGSFLAMVVWVVFGSALASPLLLGSWDLTAILFALLSLTVLRMVPVAVALFRRRFHPASVGLIGWFGPRGLASIVFMLIGLEGLHEAGLSDEPMVAVVSWTVLLSVVLHGLSARPLAGWYGRISARLPAGSPELDPIGSRIDDADDQEAGSGETDQGTGEARVAPR